MFEKLESRIVLDYEVVVESDLHIGSGEMTGPGDVDLPVLKNPEGFPIIPGSSIKGVLRSEMQKLLNTLYEGQKIKVNKANNEKLDEIPKADVHVAELFGGKVVINGALMDVAGSIRIRDASANHKKTRVRDGVRIDLATRKASRGGKYTIEVVPKGTKFAGEIYIENPKLGESNYGKLGALLATVEFFNATTRTLGGATSRGYGQVKIVIRRIREFTAQDYLSGNTQGTELYPAAGKGDYTGYISGWKTYVEEMGGSKGE